MAMLGLLVSLVACGKKGPPLAPLRIAPARIEDLQVAKTGDSVRATFTVPATNDNKTQPADLAEVQVFAITGKPEDPFGQPLSGGDFLKYASLVGRVAIKPPPVEPAAEAPRPPADAPAAPDPRPAQGERATITEQLGPASLAPFVHPRRRQGSAEPPAVQSTFVVPLTGPPVEEPPARVYVAIGVSGKGVKSPLSNRVALPLLESPAPPTGMTIGYTETTITPQWVEPAGARHPVQRAPVEGELPAKSLTTPTVTTAYNVYSTTRQGSAGEGNYTLLTPDPVAGSSRSLPLLRFGVEYCFAVRSVLVYRAARLESAPSEVACVTPVDTFPPAAPKGLVAVGSEGGVSLIWDPNTDADLGGYLVLRGEIGPDGTPGALAPITADPIKETTYRDTTARPAARYIYAVAAVDNASPRNVSPESNRVEEGAR